jgi:CRISPR-associated protein (TIGR03985 family)
MTEQVWRDRPTVPLLQWLARGSLKQHLLQAIRLWVWLHLLYGDRQTRLSLPDPFTYVDWRDAFFSDSHPTGEAKPKKHDPRCPCAKVTAAWLWGDRLSLNQLEWIALHTNRERVKQFKIQHQQWVQRFEEHGILPANLDELLYQTRLFGMTRRTLAGDLHILCEMNWLQRVEAGYQRVTDWPERPASRTERPDTQLAAHNLSFLTQPDLAAIADNLSQQFQEQQRFFVHVDYIVSAQLVDRVDEWQDQLRQVWQQQPVPPIQIRYQKAGIPQPYPLIIYPVCIYYYRRAPYLCAYGQRPEHIDNIDFRNYRLDRIEAINILSWQSTQVPVALLKQHQAQRLPTPDDIMQAMEAAWGLDFYEPADPLIVRFDQEWNQRYIRNSMRHETFQPIAYDAIPQQIRQQTSGATQRTLLKIWRDRAPDDAYYQAVIRRNDPNVKQRLRAWRPHVEVILPWDLRQTMLTEIQQEQKFYQ